MNRRSYLICGLLLLATCLGVVAQPKKSSTLVGTWTLVAVDNVSPDGKRVQLYGPEPRGILMFDANGRYSLQIFRRGRAKFTANDKSKGSPEENQAAVQGSNAHFGKYSVNEADNSITFHIEHASYPNWEGTEQKRLFQIKGDRLTYIVSTPTTGGQAAVGEVVWQRATVAVVAVSGLRDYLEGLMQNVEKSAVKIVSHNGGEVVDSFVEILE